MRLASNSRAISIIVSSQFDSIAEQSNRIVLNIEQQTRSETPLSLLFQLTVNHKIVNDNHQVFNDLTANAIVLRIYELLPKLQPANCFIQIDQHDNQNIWQLAWHLHSIQQVNVIILCKDFVPIEEETKRSFNLFNEYIGHN
ncbi:hypothetical protein M3Y97_00704200 [Aphelenchoides bicaudatus]|nr:hypothetical protein M3Y97_00704200 [Aphelenchoides bicaudatus]